MTDDARSGDGMFQSDGRRSRVHCDNCGEADDLKIALDPVDDLVFIGCPNCREDVVRADVLYGKVDLKFTTGDLDEIDPALRDDIKEALDDE